MSVTTRHIHNPEHLEPPTNGCENLKCFPPPPLKTLCDVFWMVTPCRIIHSVRNFGATYRLHLQGEWTGFTLVPQWPEAENLCTTDGSFKDCPIRTTKREDRIDLVTRQCELKSSISQNRSKKQPLCERHVTCASVFRHSDLYTKWPILQTLQAISKP